MMALPTPTYMTEFGGAYCGDAQHLLACLADESVDLVFTSPPFALQRQKEYGNEAQHAYVQWLIPFCRDVHRILKPSGSFVLDLGGAYMKGRPVRSLHNYRILLHLCDELDFRLAEEFFWYNPAKLPSPIEWVNKRKIRAKDAVNTLWWLSKTDMPKANVSNVLVPYSQRMRRLLQDAAKHYTPKKRPSGHDIGEGFATENDGAIPSNMLEIPNTDSNSLYLRLCRLANIKGHPARFPEQLPAFFIDFLTDPGDLVLDFFAGSNTTGTVAEQKERRWVAFEIKPEYVASSVFRFGSGVPQSELLTIYHQLCTEQNAGVNLTELRQQVALRLFDRD
jgi:site-specific DNA-methyltransferase (cytosine-N4-specific)